MERPTLPAVGDQMTDKQVLDAAESLRDLVALPGWRLLTEIVDRLKNELYRAGTMDSDLTKPPLYFRGAVDALNTVYGSVETIIQRAEQLEAAKRPVPKTRIGGIPWGHGETAE
jgi:hypothetical protein